MKEIMFIKDYKTQFNIPRAPLIGIPKALKAGDVRYPKGTRMIVNNYMAKRFCKKEVDWDYLDKTGKIRRVHVHAVVTKDLGLHFGRSKHIYIKDGRSKLYERRRMK